MPPVEELAKIPRFPDLKERYRVTGDDGGPLGVGRCPYSLYKEILVNPRVQRVNLDSFVDGSVSSLLEHCLGFRPRDEREERSELSASASPLTRYLASSPAPELSRVTALASEHYHEVREATDHPGGPLHVLLTLSPAPSTALASIAGALLEAGARLDQRDRAGNTPLLCLASLLQRAEWGVAADIAKLFCTRTDCDVNSVNLQGRSLLSLSLSYLDDSLEVTRTLINLGARVWPLEPLTGPGPGASVSEIIRDTESSAFTWLLRAVVSQRGLENTEASLECVAHVMAAQPERMKSHVIRVMLSEGRYPRVLGPVFLQLKTSLAPFWSRPQQLSYLAWARVRRSLGPKRLTQRPRLPGLPPPILRYLTLSSPNRGASAAVRKQKIK